MPHVEVDGLALNVDRYGDGPPVMLLHGFTGSRSTWLGLARALSGEFTTYAVDLVGHGRSASPMAVERYAMARAVDDLAGLLRALGHERATWLGYSLGGRTVLQVAVRRPEVVSALILEGASPGLPTDEERRARVSADERLARMLEQDGVEAFTDYWEALPLWESQQRTLTPATRQALRQQRLAQRAVGLANSLRGMGTGAQEWVGDRLAAIGVPVLLIAGSLDAKYSAIAREMETAIPEASLRLIDDAGHATHLERPEAFSAAVLEFLRGIRSRL